MYRFHFHLHSEINSPGYPKAALFGFCVALVAYNVLAVVKAALRSVHGEEKIANEVSGYYLAGHLGRTYDGMMIAVPEQEWHIFQSMSPGTFADTLKELANKVNLAKFKKHKRGPKKGSLVSRGVLIYNKNHFFQIGRHSVRFDLETLMKCYENFCNA